MKYLQLAALALLGLIGCAGPRTSTTSTSVDVTAVALRDAVPPHQIFVETTVDGATFPRIILFEDATASAFVGECDEDGETGRTLRLCCEHDHVHAELIENQAGREDRVLWQGVVPVTEPE